MRGLFMRTLLALALVATPAFAQADTAARGLATQARGAAASADLKARLRRMAERGARTYRTDGLIPVYTAKNWAASTTFSLGDKANLGNNVAYVVRAGMTGSTMPVTINQATADGTVIWAILGYRLPVGYANSQALVADQLEYNGGKVFRVTIPGTTASSGTGPTPASLTDGGVTFAYVGEQRLPLVTINTTLTSGYSKIVQWNGNLNNSTTPAARFVGGTIVQSGTNGFGPIHSASNDGTFPYTYSNSGGNGGAVMTNFEGSAFDIQFFPLSVGLWSDGELLMAFAGTNANTYAHVDYSGVNGASDAVDHVIRLDMDAGTQFVGFYGTTQSQFYQYTPYDDLRGIIVTDSFGSTGCAFHFLCYAPTQGRMLGFDDWRVASQGGTGIVQVNGSIVNYQTRWNADVLQQLGGNGTVVFLQGSGNDGAQTVAAVDAGARSLISQTVPRTKTMLVYMGLWNAGPVLDGNYLALNNQAKATAAALGVPFLDWSDYLTPGGYIGNSNTNGNSSLLTGSDGVHPSQAGHYLRARRNALKASAIWNLP